MGVHFTLVYYFFVSILFTDLSSCGYEVVEKDMPVPDGEGVEWMLMPDGQGNVQVAILSGLEPRYAAGLDTVNFYLYTRAPGIRSTQRLLSWRAFSVTILSYNGRLGHKEQRGDPVIVYIEHLDGRDNPKRAEKRAMNDTCLPVFKYFKPQRKSKVLVHGFGDSAAESLMFPILRDAFLARGDYNVFWVDWGEMAATPWYRNAARNTGPVGRHTASMLDHLHRSTGADMQDFHLVGFSLGAHVVGLTGKNVKTGRIKKITALDPAQVLFKSAGPEDMLAITDADDVEVVHTSGGYLGFQKALGHRDFYPNGGSWPQPGCTLDYAAVCSHRRAYYYYEEALKKGKGFKAVPCESWDDFLSGKCKDDERSLQLANESKNGKLQGKYFLGTNPSEPFGILMKANRKPIRDD